MIKARHSARNMGLTKQTRRLINKEMKLHIKRQAKDAIITISRVYAAASFWRRVRIAWGIVFHRPAAIEFRIMLEMTLYSKRLKK